MFKLHLQVLTLKKYINIDFTNFIRRYLCRFSPTKKSCILLELIKRINEFYFYKCKSQTLFKMNSKILKVIYLVSLLYSCLGWSIVKNTPKTTLEKINEIRVSNNFDEYDTTYIDLLFTLAGEVRYTDQDSMYLLINQGYELSLKSNYNLGKGVALLKLADYHAQMGKLELADENFEKAISTTDEFNLYELKSKVLNNYGLSLKDRGNLSGALIKLLESVEIAEQNNLTELLPNIYDNIALLYSEQEDYDTALKFYLKTIEIYTKYDNPKLMGRTYCNLGDLYLKMNNLKAADKAIERSILIFKKENILAWLVNCYDVKGKIQLKKEDFSEALKWFTKAEKILNNLDYTVGSVFIYNGISESYIGLKNYNNAEFYAEKSLSNAKNINFKNGIMDASSNLHLINKIKGNYKKALEYLEQSTQIKNEVSQDDFKKRMGLLRSEITIENQKKVMDEQNVRNKSNKKTYIFLSISSLIILSVILFLFYRNYHNQKLFNRELTNKQEILLESERELNYSNSTKDKLFSIIAHDLKGPINSFHSLIKMYYNGEIDKETFDQFVPKALSDIDSISSMLNNLLFWGKSQINGINTKPINTDISALGFENTRLLNPLAEKKSITIKNLIPENTIAYCDGNHINIVLRNLISNAIKFTERNGEISVTAVKKEDEILIAIKDNGVGIDDETRRTLFDKNSNKTTFGTDNEKGTGLGLALCKEMVEKNNGKICVESSPGNGSTFSFTVPIGKELEA